MNYAVGLAKSLSLVYYGARVINDLDRLFESEEYEAMKAASLATRTMLLFFSIIEMACIASNQTNSSTAINLKLAEVLVRCVDLPIQVVDGTIKITCHDKTTLEKMRTFEKVILNSVIGFFRANMELELSIQKSFRDLPKEEQNKLEFPIYRFSGEDQEIVGFRPFNLKECEETIQAMENLIPKVSAAEASANMGLVSKVIGISAQAFDLLKRRMLNASKSCDLKQLNYMPVELEEDPELSKNICALTRRPVCHIVSDPTTSNKIHYERSAIETWLKNNSCRSPVTKQLLLISQLEPCFLTQSCINHRLDLYSREINKG